ncbi:protein kinase [Saccharopolyspora sp. NPDC050642]|uniref:protein kinase domain-containing protein n=1 Tax=Saccharopolyspora sp. NPDC050642 TaxID=3157099 RepID=UPI0033CF49CD
MAHHQQVSTAPRVIGGRYRLEGTIGRGAMGYVWSGTDELLQRPVAVKELRLSPGIPEEEAAELRERALREARSMAVLSHPNAVMLYDVARDGEQPFVVMELVRAQSLSSVLNKHGALNPHQLAVLVDSVAAALQAAHQVGIVHRDVKPGNVLLGRHGQVKLADFGISRNAAESTLTRTGVLVGTPAYLAPEIAMGRSLGPSADLWSLGATLFAAAEGRLPYDTSGDPLITVSSIVHGPVPQHRQSGPIGEVISGLMIKDPERRMPLLEVRRRLQDLARDSGEAPFDALLDATEPAPLPLTHPSASSQTLPTAPVNAPKSRNGRRAAVVAGGLAVLLAGAAGVAGFYAGVAERPSGAPGVAPLEPTSGQNLGTSAYRMIEAESFVTESGGVATDKEGQVGFIGPIDNGDGVLFRGIDFGSAPATQVSARLRTWADDGVKAKIEVRLGGPKGKVVGKINVSSTTADGQAWKEVPVDLQEPVTGKRDVYLSFASDGGGDFLDLDWFKFFRR